jgi:hypothetical protein
MNPLCAVRRINLQILEDYFWVGEHAVWSQVPSLHFSPFLPLFSISRILDGLRCKPSGPMSTAKTYTVSYADADEDSTRAGYQEGNSEIGAEEGCGDTGRAVALWPFSGWWSEPLE